MTLKPTFRILLGATLFCIALCSCSRQCDLISDGHIENGIYKNLDLNWEMPLIGEHQSIDPERLDNLIRKGNLTIGNDDRRSDCTQFLLALEKSSGTSSSSIVVIRDPLSSYPNNFDMINYLDSLYPAIAKNNSIIYEGKDSTVRISGTEFRMLDSKFTGPRRAYNRVYQLKTETSMLLILISGNYLAGFEQWITSFEKSTFAITAPII